MHSIENRQNHSEAESELSKKKITANYLYRLADHTFLTEKERGKKIEDLLVQLLTCITILSVAYLTPASFLFDCYASEASMGLTSEQIMLAWMYAIVLSPLAVCLFLTLYARMLKQMSVLDSPEKLSNFAKKLLEDGSTNTTIDEFAVAQNYCDALQDTFAGMRKKHDTMWKYVKWATGLIFFSTGSALVFGLVLLFRLG